MADFNTTRTRWYSGLGLSSLFLGLFGLAFFWLIPVGIILSLAGLLVGILACILPAIRRGPGWRFALGGLALSAVALGITIAIALGGPVHWIHAGFGPGQR